MLEEIDTNICDYGNCNVLLNCNCLDCDFYSIYSL